MGVFPPVRGWTSDSPALGKTTDRRLDCFPPLGNLFSVWGVASLGSRWRTPLVLAMAGRRSPSVLLSLRVCIYTYMYTYTYIHGPPMAPCPARTRSLTRRPPRAPSKDPVSIEGPRLPKDLLLNPGLFYSKDLPLKGMPAGCLFSPRDACLASGMLG